MHDKFLNKYRISSARLQHWDYGSDALYFVTICTQNREHYFGEIADGKINLSDTGKMASRFWSEIPNHFPFVQLGEFVVMPNHVHGIIIIDKTGYDGTVDGTTWDINNDEIGDVPDGAIGNNPDVANGAIVETQNFASLPPKNPPHQKTTPPPSIPTKQPSNLPARGNIFGPQSQNLASIIRRY